MLIYLLNHLPTGNYHARWSWALVGHERKEIYFSGKYSKHSGVIYVLHSG